MVYKVLITCLTILGISFGSSYLQVNDFTGGLDTKTSPEKLKANMATELINLDFEVMGSLKKRKGSSVYKDMDINSSVVHTANGILRGITLYSDGRRYESTVTNNGYYWYGDGVSYFSELIDFTNFLPIPDGYYVISANIIITGSGGTFPNSLGYLVSGNIDYDTVTYGALESLITSNAADRISFSIIPLYNEYDLTSVIRTMDELGYNAIFKPYIIQAFPKGISDFWNNAQLNIELVPSSTVVNIDDKETNAILFDESIYYKDSTQTANVEQYTDIGRDIYFYGDDTDYLYSDYIDGFSNIGYSEPIKQVGLRPLAVSGNLTGTYSYLVTYEYDGEFESNPNDEAFVSVSATATSYNYNNAIMFGRHEGYGYFIQSNLVNGEDQYFIYKTNTENVYQASSFIFGSLDFNIIKAVFNSGRLYVLAGGSVARLYKINLSDLQIESSIDFTYGSLGGVSDFTITNNLVYVLWDIQAYGEIYLSTIKIQKYSDDLSLITDEFFTRTFEDNYNQSYGFIAMFPNNDQLVVYFLDKNGYYYFMNIANNAFTVTSAGSLGSALSLDKLRAIYNKTTKQHIFYSAPTTVVSNEVDFFIMEGSQGFNYGMNVDVETWLDATLAIGTTNTEYLVTGNKVSLTEQQMQVTIPTSNSSRVTARNIYRQKDYDGFYFLTRVPDNTTIIVTDNTSELQISTLAIERDNNVPPDAIDSCYSIARQFSLDSDGTVWYSKIGKPEAVPLLNYIKINRNGDDPPQRIVNFFGGIIVFFDNSIWYIDISNISPLTWYPRELNVDFGCKYPFTIVTGKLPSQAIGLFYLASDKSIRVLNGAGKQEIQLFDNIYTDKLSLPIEINLDALTDDPDAIYMTYYNYKLYLSIPSLSKVYVWDSRLGSWTSFEYPYNLNFIGEVDNNLLGNSGRLYKLEDEDTGYDNGSVIEWQYKSPVFANDFEVYKDYSKLWLRGSQTDQGYISTNIYSNNDNYQKISSIYMNLSGTATPNTNVRRLAEVGGRDIQFELIGTTNITLDRATIKFDLREE